MPEGQSPQEGDSGLHPEIERQIADAEAWEKQHGGVLGGIGDMRLQKQQLLAESSERIRRLTCRELTVDPLSPETSPDFPEIARLYDQNLISTDAIQRLRHDDQSALKEEMQRGGMLNRFHPTPAEREVYLAADPGFQSVREQMLTDMLGLGERPGSYHVLGLEDPQAPGKLRAWMSFRLPPPPDNAAESARHVAYLEERLIAPTLLDEPTMTYDPEMRWNFEKLRRDIVTMGEIDTANVDPAYSGALYRLMCEMPRFIESRGLPMPGHMFYYRADSLLLNFRSANLELERLGVQNNRTFSAAKNLGFYEMATFVDPKDIVARQLPDGIVFLANTKWRYGMTNMQKLRNTAEGIARKKQIIG